MNKRSFLKSSGALLTGTLLSGMTEARPEKQVRTNWAGNYRYSTEHLERPKTVEELQEVVKKCDKLRALGARHSFNGIADSKSAQVSLEHLESMSVDKTSRTVTVGAGVRYGTLAPYLQSNGFAVHNLASLPHVTVVGACATATHGSGSKNGNLSTAVSGLEIVTANGEVVTLSRHRDGNRFHGAVVALGALGVVSKITLDVVPTFDVSQVVYENLPFSRLEKHLDEIFASGYSVSLFTDWQNHRATQVWIKSKIENSKKPDMKPEFFGAKLATHKLHPLAGHSAENCTEQMGIPGPWYERLPHFRMNFTPSSGAELQSEYFVPRDKAYAAILAVEQLREKVTPHLFISEFRTIEADDLWMSPCYQRPAMAIHFTWKPEWTAVKSLLPQIEEKLKPFDARPHWAKLFTMAPSRLQSQYAKLNSFKDLLKTYDSGGKFRNQFLDTNLYGS
ncbi:MAG: FAD-binding protein [Bryobacteraceae bacterium]